MNHLKIETTSVTNGIGFRVVLWCAGCENRCVGCQNPQTWDVNSGKEFKEEDKEKIFKELDKPYIFGITLSGGDPLHPANIATVQNLCCEIKERYPEKSIWVYTGYNFEDLMRPHTPTITTNLRSKLLNYIDVLVDGRFVEELKDLTLKFRGSSNQRLIDVQESLKQNKAVLWNK